MDMHAEVVLNRTAQKCRRVPIHCRARVLVCSLSELSETPQTGVNCEIPQKLEENLSTFPMLRGGVSLRLLPRPGPVPSENFYGFRENPFSLTPNPRFLHRTRHAHETLGRLTRGILDRKGLILLSGGVGTGKTTLLYTALHLMNVSPAVQSKMGTAVIVHPTLTGDEFLEAVLDEFDLPCPSTRRDLRLEALLKLLLGVRNQGGVAVLVVDEAQMLSFDVLEEIRELLSLQTSREKLLQIVLCGQPEIEAKLEGIKLPDGESLVAVRCHTAPLSLKDTHEYVQHRLRVACARSDALFAPEAVDAIHVHTNGIPRLINLLCAQALSVAAAGHAARVFPHMVDEAAAKICSGALAPPCSGATLGGRAIFVRSNPLPVSAALTDAAAAKVEGALRAEAASAEVSVDRTAPHPNTEPAKPASAINAAVRRPSHGDAARPEGTSAGQCARKKRRALRRRAKSAQAAARLAQARARQVDKLEFTEHTAQPPAEYLRSEFRASPFRRARPRCSKRPTSPQGAMVALASSLPAWNRWLNRWCSEHFTSKGCGKPLFQLGLAGTLFLALAQAIGTGLPERHAAHVTFGFMGMLFIDVSLGLGTYLLLIERRLTPANRAPWAQTLLRRRSG
jgi:general secretion pathway protein A